MRVTSLIFVWLGLVAGGCSVSKYVPAGESLLVGGRVKVVPDSAALKDVGTLEDQLEERTAAYAQRDDLGLSLQGMDVLRSR